MVKMKVNYQGHFHCALTHEPSGNTIETDAPKDNQGKGERFSPTDLVGAALASCILTTMAIVSERNGFTLQNAEAHVEKNMIDKPRRIESLSTHISLPSSLTEGQRSLLEQAAMNCPVKQSLHPDLKTPMSFKYF